MHFRARFGVLFVLVLILFFRVEISTLVFGPILEKTLTQLFGTEVSMKEFRFDPLNGHLEIKEFMIMNQPGFTRRPHFRADLEARVDMRNLFTTHIRLKSLLVRHGYFLIEKHRVNEDDWNEESRFNIKTWIRHMKGAPGKSSEEKEPPQEKPSAWQVQIDQITLDNVAFIYDYRTSLTTVKKRYVFQNLRGELEGFKWPTANPSELTQNVYLDGFIGLTKPAPVWIKGKANFSSSKISFNLTGEIHGGTMNEYKHFWEDLPVKVSKGDYDLYAKAICVERKLNWENDLVIHKMKLQSKRTTSAFIWGLPIKASMSFLESQEKIDLKMPVQGDIGDPRLSPAFGKAFREALTRYTQSGLGMFKEPVKMMAKTGGVMAEAPVKVMGETLEKMATLVMNPKEQGNPVPLDQESLSGALPAASGEKDSREFSKTS